MSRFDPDPPTRRATRNGEVLTVAEVNDRIVRLLDELERTQPEIQRLLKEHRDVSLAYDLRYASVIQTSEARSEDRRKAEATAVMYEVRLDDSPIDLATRKAELEMQIKAMREYSHNVRAQLSATQTLSANLRSEATAIGARL